MVLKKGSGYYVYSHTGRVLGGPYKTRKAALKRLAQIEYFKHKNKK